MLVSDSGVVFTKVSLVGKGGVSWHIYFCAPVIVGECFLCGSFDGEVFTGFKGDDFLFVLGSEFDGWFEWNFFVVGSGFVFNGMVLEWGGSGFSVFGVVVVEDDGSVLGFFFVVRVCFGFTVDEGGSCGVDGDGGGNWAFSNEGHFVVCAHIHVLGWMEYKGFVFGAFMYMTDI